MRLETNRSFFAFSALLLLAFVGALSVALPNYSASRNFAIAACGTAGMMAYLYYRRRKMSDSTKR